MAAALAHLASQEMPIVLADADVDAANLELVFDPTVQETHDFASGKLAVVDPKLCTGCDICAQVCRYDAVAPTTEPGQSHLKKHHKQYTQHGPPVPLPH